ncbi:MAG: amino acid ABC transporter permease [Lacisediminihabitans sp.]
MSQFLLDGLWVTLTIWVGAFALSIILAIPVAAARRSQNSLIKFIGAIWVGVARGIPPIIWLLILYYGVSIGPIAGNPILAAIVALGIVNSAYVGDGIRAGLESVPQGQWEAAQAMALPKIVVMFRVILPQAFPIMLASTAAYSIVLLKNTALASIIGVNEMVFYAYTSVQAGIPAVQAFLTIGVVYMIFSVPVGLLARWIEGRSVIATVR